MNVVVDTNVLVSAILKDGTPEQVILEIAARPQNIHWLVTPEIRSEYWQVLSRKKFKLSDVLRDRWFGTIDTLTTIVGVDIGVDFPRDRKDAKFIACAVAADADYLITGDRDFREVESLMRARVVSPATFLAEIEAAAD